MKNKDRMIQIFQYLKKLINKINLDKKKSNN